MGTRRQIVVGSGEEAMYVVFQLEGAGEQGEQIVRNCKVSILLTEALVEGYVTEEALEAIPVVEALPDGFFQPF